MPKNPPAKQTQQGKAAATAKRVSKPIQKRSHQVRTKARFYRPVTKVQTRSPRVLRTLNAYNTINRIDQSLRILIQPLSSEKNMTKMEKENTLTFLVDSRANKNQIKQAFKKMFDAKVRSVNTLIRPDGHKKAFIRLAPGVEALKLASKIGIL